MDKRDIVAFSIDNSLDINEKAEIFSKKEIYISDYSRADEILNYCDKKGIRIISIFDDEYPKSLKDVFAPPYVLYVLGSIPKYDRAITGISTNSSKNNKIIKKTIRKSIKSGDVFVSKLSPGFAASCAKSIISSNNQIIMVANRSIDYKMGMFSQEIVKHGAIVSEYAPGINPEKMYLRDCNRIIIGLSNIAIIDNAIKGSEAYLFACEAIENNRKVVLYGNYERKLLNYGANPILSNENLSF